MTDFRFYDTIYTERFTHALEGQKMQRHLFDMMSDFFRDRLGRAP